VQAIHAWLIDQSWVLKSSSAGGSPPSSGSP
jgi:hypothetical protein